MRKAVIIRIKRWVQPELDRTMELLRKSNDALSRAMQENTALKNRNDGLNVQLNRLSADNRDLHHQVELLKKANEIQGATIARMERHQKELEGRYEHMLSRVVQLEAKYGLL